MARGGTDPDVRSVAPGPLEPSWPALAGLTVAAIAGFIGVGILIGVPTALLPTYAALVALWWTVTAIVLGLTVPALSTWPPIAMGAAQGATLILTWAAALAAANPLGLSEWWLLIGLRLPVCVILVVGFGQILRARELAALERAAHEGQLLQMQRETQSLIEAHAAIVEEARHASTDLTAAVRAALRMSHSKGASDAAVRDLLDDDIRRRASQASRKIQEIGTPTPAEAKPRLRRLGPWLDDLAFAPHWHIAVAYALLLGTMLIADLANPRWLQATPLLVLACALGFIVTASAAWLMRRRLTRWSPWARRSAFPLSLLAGLTVALPVSTLAMGGLAASEVALASLSRLPAALAIIGLPGAYSAARWRSAIGMSEIDAQIALGMMHRDLAKRDLDRVRRTIISTLHTHVQGRAAAALTALDLADAGVPRTRHIVDAVLEELADLDIAGAAIADPPLIPPDEDPVGAVIASWAPVLEITRSERSAGRQPWHPATRLRVATHLEDALVNAAIHGRARRIRVDLQHDHDSVTLVVEDDGVGIAGEINPGLGLRQLEQRGGTWDLRNRQGGGAVLRGRLPARSISRPEDSPVAQAQPAGQAQGDD